MNKKCEPLIFAVLMSVTITLPMSFLMTLINVGVNSVFLPAFFQSVMLGLLVSIPLSLLAVPYVRRVVNKLVRN